MKKISVLFLAITLVLASCKNYDDEFTALNESIAALQTQVAGFSSLQASLTTLQGSVGTLQTAVNAIPTTQVDLSGLQASLTASLANIAALQADLNTVIANYATSTDLAAAQASIDALTAALAAAQIDVTAILAANNIYTGNLNIRNAAELTFAQSLSANLSIINGHVNINNTTISAAAVSTITSGIISVTGSVDVVSVASVDLSSLVSVGMNYDVAGVDIADQALTTVDGNVTLDYRGPYSQPNLVSATTVTFVPKAISGTLAVTSAVDFSGLTSGVVNAGTVTVPEATSVKLNVINTGLSTVTAAKALTVDLLAANYKGGLTVDAQKAASAITITGNMFSGTTYGALSVTGSATSTLSAVAVTKAGTITVITIAKALAFPTLTDATTVTASSTVSFIAADLVPATISVAAAKVVSIASVDEANVTFTALEDLTFSALTDDYTSVSANLTDVDVTGDGGSFTTVSATLENATFGGELTTVSIIPGAADVLESLTTTGTIDQIILTGTDILETVSFGHSEIAGNNGSVLTVTNNGALESLTTSGDYLRTLTVKGNTALVSADFSSYATASLTGIITLSVSGNALTGTYKNAVAAVGTTPYAETEIVSIALATLKPLVAAWTVATTAPVTSVATITYVIDLDAVKIGTGSATLLSVKMLADSTNQGGASTSVTDVTATSSTHGITTITEFALVQ